MTKEKPLHASIPNIYKRCAEDLLMYGYVAGMQRALPSVSLKKCIEMYMKDFNLEEDDYPQESARRTFSRIRKGHGVL